MTIKDLDLAGFHISGRDEELDAVGVLDDREINTTVDHVLQRIHVQGIELVGREHPRHRVHRMKAPGFIKTPVTHPDIKGCAFDRAAIGRV